MKHIALISIALLCLGCASPSTGQPNGQSKIFNGRLIMWVGDNFKQGIAQVDYSLRLDGDGRILPLILPNQREIPNAESGTPVEIRGRQQNGQILVESLRILQSNEK